MSTPLQASMENAAAGENGERYDNRAHNPQAVSDWLNPLSLRTISAFGTIANLA